MKYWKLPTGNYRAKTGNTSIFIRKRPHGAWNAIISHDGVGTHSEGYLGTSLPTIAKAKALK